MTHVVLPFGPDGDPDDGQEYMRTLRRECAPPALLFPNSSTSPANLTGVHL